MAGTTFIETLRRNWQSMLGWGIGVGMLAIFMIFIVSDPGVTDAYQDMLEIFPPVMLNAIGLSGAESLGTPEGFLAYGFFTFGSLVLAAYAIMAGANITINDEDEGTLDMVLSLPLPRWQFLVETFAAQAVIAAGIVAVAFIGIPLGMLFTGLELDMGMLFPAALAMIPSILAIMAMTAFVGTVVRTKTMAMSAASGIVVASYFLNFLGESAPETILADLRRLSVFYYFNGEQAVMNGVNMGHVAVLLAAGLVLVVGAVFAFERRDIGL